MGQACCNGTSPRTYFMKYPRMVPVHRSPKITVMSVSTQQLTSTKQKLMLTIDCTPYIYSADVQNNFYRMFYSHIIDVFLYSITELLWITQPNQPLASDRETG